VGEIHNLMPVILPPEDYGVWLDSDMREAEPLLDLLGPHPNDAMETHPVSRFVSSPKNNNRWCVEPAA
jgi:putative SOS response-associated peptidase YedK